MSVCVCVCVRVCVCEREREMMHLDDEESVLLGVLSDVEDLGHAHVARKHLLHHHHLLAPQKESCLLTTYWPEFT